MMIDGRSAFWIVTKPHADSEMVDILFEATFSRLALQFAGGLDPVEIIGLYVNREDAESVARIALGVRDAKVASEQPFGPGEVPARDEAWARELEENRRIDDARDWTRPMPGEMEAF